MFRLLIVFTIFNLAFPNAYAATFSHCAAILGWQPNNSNPLPEMNETKALILKMLSTADTEMSSLQIFTLSGEKGSGIKIYRALGQLADDGLLSFYDDSSEEVLARRRGRPLRFFSITIYGRRILSYWEDYILGSSLQETRLKSRVLEILMQNGHEHGIPIKSLKRQILVPWYDKYIFWSAALNEMSNEGLVVISRNIDQETITATDLGRRA